MAQPIHFPCPACGHPTYEGGSHWCPPAASYVLYEDSPQAFLARLAARVTAIEERLNKMAMNESAKS